MYQKMFDTSKARLLRNGLEHPLDETEVLGNYTTREGECNANLRKARLLEDALNGEIKHLESEERSLQRALNSDVTNLDGVEEVTEWVDVGELSYQFKTLNRETSNKLTDTLKRLDRLKQSHNNDGDSIIRQILDTIDTSQLSGSHKCTLTLNTIANIQRGVTSQIHNLDGILKHIDDNYQHVVEQVYSHAKQLYGQVLSIVKLSYVRFGNVKCKTLDLNIPKQLDGQAKAYIESMVNKVFTNLKNAPEDTTEYIKNSFSDRAMFNAITNTSTVSVRVYKVRQDNTNTLERWESAYSGGERFLTYFIVYSTLMLYTRSHFTCQNGEKTRSVFLIDNPFGATSSNHLLKALVDVTSRYNLQLVCFSDLKQSSITNHFNLIYQLSLKRATYSEKSYLTTDNVTGNGATNLNHLENISLKQLHLDGF
jgi:hypothetical protein